MKIPFIGGANLPRSVNLAKIECINLFVEYQNQESKNIKAAYGTPGTTLFATPGTAGVGRGLYVSSIAMDKMYAVVSRRVYSVASNGTMTELGELDSYSGRVKWADNGNTGGTIMLVDGDSGYWIDVSTQTLTKITDAAFLPLNPNGVAFINGYFLVADGASTDLPGMVQVSPSYYNGSQAWDALDYFSAEGNPDRAYTCVAHNRDLWIFGPDSYEVWYHSGSAQKFNYRSGTLSDIGLLSADALAQTDTSLYWVGGSRYGFGGIWRSDGYKAVKISKPWLDTIIQGYGSPALTTGFCYQMNGHEYYVLNFDIDNVTWVYDLTTDEWHRRSYWEGDAHQRWRGKHYSFFFKKDCVQDWANGKIYVLDKDVYTDDGNPITRDLSIPYIHAGLKNLFHRRLQIDMETGVGLPSGPGSDPKVKMRYSDDYGHTWSSELLGDIGAAGAYNSQVKWERLGMARARGYKIRITDPVKVALIGAEIEAEVGRS